MNAPPPSSSPPLSRGPRRIPRPAQRNSQDHVTSRTVGCRLGPARPFERGARTTSAAMCHANQQAVASYVTYCALRVAFPVCFFFSLYFASFDRTSSCSPHTTLGAGSLGACRRAGGRGRRRIRVRSVMASSAYPWLAGNWCSWMGYFLALRKVCNVGTYPRVCIYL